MTKGVAGEAEDSESSGNSDGSEDSVLLTLL